ncbi:putative pectate lyase 3, partial [Mucuna pruriens]
MVNSKLGTLHFTVVQQGSLWIIFERSITIELRQELLISSNSTIDGRGADVGLTMQYVNNVLIHGIRVKKIMPKDGNMIRNSYNHFGLRIRSDDHVFLSDSIDGLIDVIIGSTVVTISNCHLSNHNNVMLFGARY